LLQKSSNIFSPNISSTACQQLLDKKGEFSLLQPCPEFSKTISTRANQGSRSISQLCLRFTPSSSQAPIS
jgi:hypothetical protein